jgi:hypothetical protein
MIPERRKHRRILTLKNLKRAVVLLVVFFAGLSIEVATRQTTGEYGRIMDKGMPHTDDIRPRPPAPVTEAPVADQTAADPMLVAPAARQQEFLSTASVAPQAGLKPDLTGEPAPSGIVITRTRDVPKRAPVLAGGIFKNQ